MATHTSWQRPTSLTALSCLGLGAFSSSSSSSCCCCALPPRVSPLHFSSVAWQRTRSRRHTFFFHAVVDEAEVVVVPSTGLTMNLKVEGTLADSLIPKVTDVLKNVEGVSNLKVYTSEGVATVELEKQTTIQATGEASSLLEKIQGEGFKLQNLCISFDDAAADADEDIAYEYESTS